MVRRRKIFVVSIPVHIPGQPFHRGEIKLHDDKILSKNSQGTAENDCISQYPKVYHKTMENDRKVPTESAVRHREARKIQNILK